MHLQDWIQEKYINPQKFVDIFVQAKPFPHIMFKEFFRKDKIDAVLRAIAEQEFYKKDADLFRFSQTQDLTKTKNPILRELYAFLISAEFVAYMRAITEWSLKEDMLDLHSTIYENTDYLLCHDDELDSRKIAFLIYLTDMKKNEGGSLDLFSEKRGMPGRIVKSIVPQYNVFAFFEVSRISFHAVAEVIVDKQRIAIGGWFHA